VNGLLASPRRRRRLAWFSIGAGIVAATAVGVALLPGSPKPVPEHLRPGPVIVDETPVRLTASMRLGIDRTLARFVPAAVTRKDPALAWQLAGPELRAGTTRRDWMRGNMPVYKYPWRGDVKGLKGWAPFFTFRNRVGFDLLLHPTKKSLKGPMAVSVDLVRRGPHWLVNYWNVTAIMTGPKERAYVTGVPDYGPGGVTAKGFYEAPRHDQSKLGAGWLLLPVGVVAAIVLVTAGYGVRRRRRDAA
jgi:hypothetical protein